MPHYTRWLSKQTWWKEYCIFKNIFHYYHIFPSSIQSTISNQQTWQIWGNGVSWLSGCSPVNYQSRVKTTTNWQMKIIKIKTRVEFKCGDTYHRRFFLCSSNFNSLWPDDAMDPVQYWFRLCLNTLRPGQNYRHFANDIFKCIFLNGNVWISLKISLKFVPEVRISNIPALVQKMAWRRQGDKPSSEPVMVSLLTRIYASLGLDELIEVYSTPIVSGDYTDLL